MWSKYKAPLRFSARPERFELPTFGSVDRRSIQLSYGRLRVDSSRGSATDDEPPNDPRTARGLLSRSDPNALGPGRGHLAVAIG